MNHEPPDAAPENCNVVLPLVGAPLVSSFKLAPEERAFLAEHSLKRPLVVLTWLFACGAVDDSNQLAVALDGTDISYPLAKVIGSIPVGKSPLAVFGFGLIALFGLIAS